MVGTHPQPPGRDTPSDTDGAGWWWWLVIVAVALVVVLLVVQPWAEHQTEPPPTGTPSSASDVPVGPTSTATESAPPPTSPGPAAGADAVFDAATMTTLLVTDLDLVAGVPAAAPGVQPGPSVPTWGLPPGATITPESCTTTVTVVATSPDAYTARAAGNDAFAWEQRVTVLADAPAALQAFRDLVTTVDACPEYAESASGTDGVRWTAQPAIEGQGLYPSIVQERTRAADGSSQPEYRGHMLVGNTIVTWTATALATNAGPEEALATLGEPGALDAMVQAAAQRAVDGLD